MHRIRDSSSPVDTNPKLPEHEHLNCPRCRSTNTKFCYYNNYNLSQPRHYCKNCRRYWTKGGTLRNIPIGGATRKITKRASPATTTAPPPLPAPAKPEPELEHSAMEPFGSLLMEVSVGDESGSNYLRLNYDENNGKGGSERGETSCWNGWLA